MPKSYFRVRAVVAEPLRQKFDHRDVGEAMRSLARSGRGWHWDRTDIAATIKKLSLKEFRP